MITAEVIADSICPFGNRLISFLLVYPRFIHSEFMTHRVWSRNAASSRAIPVSKMIERVLNTPAMPISWGKNQKGMQAGEDVSIEIAEQAKKIWIRSARIAVAYAKKLSKIGLHKQIVNRVLEPYSHITTIATATELGNFYNLRHHKDAQPEFKELAHQMLLAQEASTPKCLQLCDWHIPFGDKFMPENISLEDKLIIATARCARVSYLNFDGDISYDKDKELHDSLLESGHFSPFEHCARVNLTKEINVEAFGNFRGYHQYRKMLRNENKKEYNPHTLLRG